MEGSLEETRDELKEIFDELDTEYKSLNEELLSIVENIDEMNTKIINLKTERDEKAKVFKKHLEALIRKGNEYNSLTSDINKITQNIQSFNESNLRTISNSNQVQNYKDNLGFLVSIKTLNTERFTHINESLENDLKSIDKDLKNIINMFDIVNMECDSNLK